MSSNDDQWNAFRLIGHRRIVDAHLLTGRLIYSHSAFNTRNHEILDSHIGERAPGHDAIVAAACPVAVELRNRYALLLEVDAGRRGWLNRPSRADVIGSHRITEDRERPGANNIGDPAPRHLELLEEWRLLNVGRRGIPIIDVTNCARNLIP